jgi:hypothetical protein
VQLDDNRPVRRDAMLCVVGNVGKLRGNVTLSPCARPERCPRTPVRGMPHQ